MKVFFVTLGIVFGLHIFAFGQQRSQYTQYATNNYLLNPAISGIERYIDLKTGQRKQWTGLNEAPVTSYFSIQMPIGMPEDIYGDNSMNRSYTENYKAPEPHHGIGMNAIIDQPGGPLSTTNVNLTYAYHLGLSNKMTLSMGVSAGMMRTTLDGSKVDLGNGNSADPAVNPGSTTSPDLGLGLWLYGPNYFAGVSAQGLLGQPITFAETNAVKAGKQATHLFITTGVKLFLSEDIAVVPSILVKYVNPAPISFDFNTKIAFKDSRFWIGGGYRQGDSFAAMAGVIVGGMLNFSYSRDFTNSELKSISGSTNEIVLGLMLNNRFKVRCPQENW